MHNIIFQGNFVSYLKRMLPITALAIIMGVVMAVSSWKIVKPVESKLLFVISVYTLQITSDLENTEGMLKMLGVDEEMHKQVMKAIFKVGVVWLIVFIIFSFLAVWWCGIHWRYMVAQSTVADQHFSFQGRVSGIAKLYGLGLIGIVGVFLISLVFTLFGDITTLLTVFVITFLLMATWWINRALRWFFSMTHSNNETISYQGSFGQLLLQLILFTIGLAIACTATFFILKRMNITSGFGVKQLPMGLLITLMSIALRIFWITILARFIVNNISLKEYQFNYLITGRSIMKLTCFYLLLNGIIIGLAQLTRLYTLPIHLYIATGLYLLILLALGFYTDFYVSRHVLKNIRYERRPSVYRYGHVI